MPSWPPRCRSFSPSASRPTTTLVGASGGGAASHRPGRSLPQDGDQSALRTSSCSIDAHQRAIGAGAPGPLRPQLADGAVHMWRAGPGGRAGAGCTAESRGASTPRVSSMRTAASCGSTHGAAADADGRCLGRDRAGLRFTHWRVRKPALVCGGRDPLSFNMSHSGATALYAFSGAGEIGVDVETARRSSCPQMSGGASWMTGLPRSSARHTSPASNSAWDRNPRSSRSDSSPVNVSRVTLFVPSRCRRSTPRLDVPHDRQVVELLQRGAERGLVGADVPEQVFLLEDVQVGQGHRA